MTFALYFANRGFFPESLIASARQDMYAAVEKAGYKHIEMAPSETHNGAIETADEGRVYAKWLKDHEGEYDGIIICLPNFGDENGAVPAMRDANVPILIQAYPDEFGMMDFEHRRDAYCGKFSISDMFNQFGIKYTLLPPHVVHPSADAFQQNLHDFAAVCRVVKANRRFTIGGIGARTTLFKTVRWDELTLQKYGITFESYDLSELFSRMRDMKDNRSDLKDKMQSLKQYSDFSKCPDEHFSWLAKMSVAIDDMVAQYHFDALSIRCWNEMHNEFKIAPCVLLSELNNRGIATSCEMDVTNVVTMRALQAASECPAGCVDWNNNYGDDPDKVILFHCGPIAQELMAEKGVVGVHKMFAKGNDPDHGWGVNEGRIAKMPMTISSATTLNGKLYTYVDEGEFTGEPIENTYFGCAGVAQIKDLQKKVIYMQRAGFRHHTTFGKGHVKQVISEAFNTYLGYEHTEL